MAWLLVRIHTDFIRFVNIIVVFLLLLSGAAFAENIMGGLSTSLAVFCHELPHELGDFAILIKAGMSVKSAVYYNLLTGILSFIGMIFGIIFGQSHDSVQWMFAVAAGLFIYIAMVDMVSNECKI